MEKNNQGFTIIEISLVLVLIGIMAGAVIAGDAVIDNSRGKKIIAESIQFQIGVTTFVGTYGQLPGDFSDAAASFDLPRSGNGDLIITGSTEPYDFFLHLSKEGLVTKNLSIYTPNATPPVLGSQAMAGRAYDNSIWEAKAIDTITANPGYADMSAYPRIGYETTQELGRNFLVFSLQNYPSEYNTAGGVPPNVVMTIDSKIDDGKAGRGRVRGGNGWMGAEYSDCVTAPGDNYRDSASYNVDSEHGCAILFAIQTTN